MNEISELLLPITILLIVTSNVLSGITISRLEKRIKALEESK